MQTVWSSIVLLERKARSILMHEIDNFSVTKIVSLHPTITPSTKIRFVLHGTIPSKLLHLCHHISHAVKHYSQQLFALVSNKLKPSHLNDGVGLGGLCFMPLVYLSCILTSTFK